MYYILAIIIVGILWGVVEKMLAPKKVRYSPNEEVTDEDVAQAARWMHLAHVTKPCKRK